MNKLFLLVGALLLMVTTSLADVTRKQCTADATSARKEAVTAATSTFNAAITACRGPCYETCRSTFQSCTGTFKATKQECVTSAEQVFAAAVLTCQTSTACGTLGQCYANKAFQTCLVDPRVARRLSIRSCNSAEVTGVKAAGCGSALSTCNKACRTAEKK